MSLITIIANNIELDFVRETLSIKVDNNALSNEFKVSHSIYPFLIIENKNAKIALGSRDIASVNKKKTIPVAVFEGGKRFYGEIQVLSYLNGFRKCNLKYGSSLLSIMSTKIADFLPTVSVIPGELNPEPYTEQSENLIAGSENWKTYPVPFLNQKFPEVKWQFPTMKWTNKFGVDLDVDDKWKQYGGKINEYNEEGLIENSYTIGSGSITVQNKNVPAAQVFLLSPAFYALQSLGFKLTGNFGSNELIKRLLFTSTKNNLTETKPVKETGSVIIPPSSGFNVRDEDDNILYYMYYGVNITTTTIAGTYIFNYDFEEPYFAYDPDLLDRKMFQIFLFNEPIYTVYTHYAEAPAQRYTGSVKLEVSPEQVGFTLFVRYYSPIATYPAYTITKKIVYPQVYFQMHPTIDLGRYLPDWTFGTYLNELKNLFNLEINTNDFKKELEINFNDETLLNAETYIEKKSLQITGYQQATYNAAILKYDNDQDDALWITTEAVTPFDKQKSDFLKTISSKFKFVPTTYSAELSEELESKSGTGLMIYDPANKPYTSSNYLGQNLSLGGAKGIYELFWKKSLKFEFNSSSVEMSGPFTETEKNNILRLKRIFIDNQEYIIASVQYSDTTQDNYILKFSLQSVNF